MSFDTVGHASDPGRARGDMTLEHLAGTPWRRDNQDCPEADGAAQAGRRFMHLGVLELLFPAPT